MTLAEYLAKTKTTILAFAEKADLHPATIHRLLNGDAPQGGTINKVLKATDGKVTPNDLLLATKGRKARRKSAA